MIEELAERIWNSDDFKTDYRDLVKYGLIARLNGDQRFEGFPVANGAPGEEAVQKLVQSAANLSATQQVEYREAAYRIGVYALAGYSNSLPNVVSASKLIFGRLGNFPAAGFLKNGDYRERTQRLPLPLWLDYEAHSDKNTVEPSEEVHLTLTDFQKALWDSLIVRKATSFTAPTSAGKTFALQHYLVSRYLKSSTGVFVYLVPTRALISQIVTDVSQIGSQYGDKLVNVSSVPLPQKDLGVGKTIYILTQERLQILLERDSSLDVRVLVVDEAQELGAGSRGVILQTVVDRIRRSHSEAQFLFSSPQASNPDLFGDLFGLEDFEVVEESESPVAQNLLFVQLDRESGLAVVSAHLDEAPLELGCRELPEGRISSGSDKNRVLAAVADEFGRGGTSLIYAGAPSRCESIAAYLYDLADNSGPVSEEDERKRAELSEFLKDQIHEEYLLATTVQNGVGYHYGNMPSIVRRLIERYFREGVLTKLVSTSTLLHGVNLAAQNLFLLNPTKGKNTPLTDVEFWNLAGRAGRLTKDFEGDIFVVEPSKWSSKQFDGNRRSAIEPSLRESVVSEAPEFIDFINDVEHPSGEYEQYESSFVRLFNDAREGSLRDTLKRLDLKEEEYSEVLDGGS